MPQRSQHEIVPTLRSELMATSAEVATLEERLRLATEKADRIKALLAIYESETPNVSPEQDKDRGRADMVPKKLERVDPRPFTTKKARMEREITNLLNLHGSLHRTDILSHLQGQGLFETDKNPLAHLAAYLSNNRDKFASDGRGNFTIAAPQQGGPPPVPSGSGSAEGRNPGSNPGLPFNHQQH